MSKCKHLWNCDHAVYCGDVVRRYCNICGLIQKGQVENWKTFEVGPSKQFDHYPEGYPEQFMKGVDDGNT